MEEIEIEIVLPSLPDVPREVEGLGQLLGLQPESLGMTSTYDRMLDTPDMALLSKNCAWWLMADRPRRRIPEATVARLPEYLRILSELEDAGDHISSDRLAELAGKDVTLSGRGDLWRYLFAEIPRHPWIGLGHGAYWLGEFSASAQAVRRTQTFGDASWKNFELLLSSSACCSYACLDQVARRQTSTTPTAGVRCLPRPAVVG